MRHKQIHSGTAILE